MAAHLASKQSKAAQREQEDAHEFFNFLVDATHVELLKLRAANAQTVQGMPPICNIIHLMMY